MKNYLFFIMILGFQYNLRAQNTSQNVVEYPIKIKDQVEFNDDEKKAHQRTRLVYRQFGSDGKSKYVIQLVALLKDQNFPLFKYPNDVWIQILEGKATLVINGEDYLLEEGEVFVVPLETPHEVRANGKNLKFMIIK